MPSNLLTEPETGADIPASSGTLESGLRRDQTPLQSQSCYVTGGSSIRICFITALSTLEQLSLSVKEHPVSLRSVATFRTSLRCSCCWNFNYINSMLPCYRLNSSLKFSKWNSMYFSVGFLRLSAPVITFPQMLEFLDSYDCIVSHRNFNNFMRNLPYPCVDEVSFIMLHPAESTPCSLISFIHITPKLASSLHEFPLLVPYILSKIQLLFDSTITSQNRQSKTTTVNINSHNSLIICFNFKLLSKVSNNDIMTILLVQSKLRAFPTIFKMLNKPFISTILLDWQGNSAISIKGCNNNGITTFSFAELSRARDIKPNWNLVELFSIQVLPYLVDAINEDLGVQAVFSSNNWVGGGM